MTVCCLFLVQQHYSICLLIGLLNYHWLDFFEKNKKVLGPRFRSHKERLPHYKKKHQRCTCPIAWGKKFSTP